MLTTRLFWLTSALAALTATLLADPAQAAPRTVALTPFSANTMSLLGIQPVAIGQALGDTNLFAPKLKAVRRLTLTHPSGPNMEELAKLNPKLVFTAPAWARGTAGMRRLGAQVVVREPRTIAQVPVRTRQIGALLGKRTAAGKLAALQARQIAVATKGIKRHPKVLLVLGVGRTPYAFLPNSWGGNLIQRAGGRLITGNLKSSSGYARISDEFVVSSNPDVIIAVPHGSPKNIAAIAKQLAARAGWRTTKAARSKQIFISTNNTLLQPIVGAGVTLGAVRQAYLKN